MMAEDDPHLLAALAIVDGTPVDWTGVSAASGALFAELRFIEALVRVHDSLNLPAAVQADQHDSLLHPTGTDAAHPSDTIVRWGPLTVFDKVGRGSFGDVYRAWDPRLDREVALKLLRHRAVGDDTLGTAAIEEGRLLARVRHPNVLTVYGAERIDDRVGIWMEFIRGHTLADEIESRGALDAMEAARIGVDICGALQAVHEAGLVHRDITARNILRDESGRIVLGDFGAGTEVGDTSDPQVAGTPLYLAPSVLEGRPANASTDLYSAGVLLYYLVSGFFPVTGHSLRELQSAHRNGNRTPLRERRPDLPSDFTRIVDRLLETGPDRPALRADAIAAELNAFAGSTRSGHKRADLVRRRLAAAVVTLLTTAALAFALRDTVRQWGSGSSGGGSTTVRLIAKDPECAGPLSPDGRFFGCVERTSRSVALSEISTGQTRRLTSVGSIERGESGADPLFSDDGQRVAFRWMRRGAPDEIRVVPVESGGEQTLIRGEPGTSWSLIGWRPGGELLAVASTGADRAFVWLDAESGSTLARHQFTLPPIGFVLLFGWLDGEGIVGLRGQDGTVVLAAVGLHGPIREIATLPNVTVYQSCTGRTCARIRCQTARRWTRTRYSCRRPENRPDQHGDRGPSLRPLADVDTGWGPLALQ